MQTHTVGFKQDGDIPARSIPVTFDSIVSEMPEGYERDRLMKRAYDQLAIDAQQRLRPLAKERTEDGSDWLYSDADIQERARNMKVDDMQGDGRSRLTPEDKAVRFVVDVGMSPADASSLVSNVTDAAINEEKQRRQDVSNKEKSSNSGKTANKKQARKAS